MSTDEPGRLAASEGMLAAILFAIVSLLLVAALLRDSAATLPGNGAESAASRSAGRP